MAKAHQALFRTFDPGLLLVGLLVLLAVSPLFPPGLPGVADAPIHLFRTLELVSCWADGVYYPRWAPDLAFGYGYPLFDFAPPLPYFVAGALHVAGFSLETALKLLSVLCLACYGLGMYLFARNVLGRRGALLAAAAYVYTPFRFREFLLYGGNYPQILAIGLFPWVLWAFERIVSDGRRRYVVAGALCYAALILSHNFHAFIFTPLLVVYSVCLLLLNRQRRRLLAVVAALALGLALTAFFWGPALYDLQYVAAREEYYLARSDFRLRLLNLGDLLALPVPLDSRADNPYVPFGLGIAVVALALPGLAYPLFDRLSAFTSAPGRAGKDETRPERLHLAFFLAVLLGACFMMLPPSAPLWANLPFLPYAEFPWRLMGIANLGAAFLVGGGMRLWERLPAKRSADLILAASLLALILGVAVYFYPVRPFLQWGTPSLGDYVNYELSTQNLGTTGLAEYLPRWADEVPTSSPLVGLLREGKPVEKLDRPALPAGTQAVALAHTPDADRYRFDGETGFRARFFTFYYPGWQALLDGETVPIQVVAPFGLMAVDVPAGEHELLLKFEETPFRLTMDAISLGVVGLACWLFGRLIGMGAIRAFYYLKGQRGDERPRPGYSWGWAWPSAALLVVVFAGKVGFVDHHTNWFRQESPPGRVAGAQHPMYVRLEDNAVFLGYDLVGAETSRAGELLQVRLYWQAAGPVGEDYISFAHLDAPPDDTTFASADNFQPGDPQSQNDVPSTQWSRELYVRDEHRLALPGDIPPIAYSLRVGLYERRTGRRLAILSGAPGEQKGDTIFLQWIHVLPASLPKPATVQSWQKYRLGRSLELLGHSLDSDGQAVTVTLYWQPLEPMGRSYTVFVHLLDGAGQVRSQHDGLPVNGRYPTDSWLLHQVVEDRHTLALGPDLPPGEYRVAVGMYDLATGQRLPVEGIGGGTAADAILLQPTLRIGE